MDQYDFIDSCTTLYYKLLVGIALTGFFLPSSGRTFFLCLHSRYWTKTQERL